MFIQVVMALYLTNHNSRETVINIYICITHRAPLHGSDRQSFPGTRYH